MSHGKIGNHLHEIGYSIVHKGIYGVDSLQWECFMKHKEEERGRKAIPVSNDQLTILRTDLNLLVIIDETAF